MKPVEILKDFNSCYVKIQAVAQSPEWQKLIAEMKIDPEAATHLGDVLHYLEVAIGCVDECINQEKKS
ncbi:hypothetical protein WKK05_38345 (plasmid) [Nostoc sp. UHCC 0302]|uniref:hypothetical protein n=1 Tax=Nostoc sp. UHCC 0302 TaxID=3134896 RepID=UPI00311CBD68